MSLHNFIVILIWLITVIVILFIFVIAFGAPFLPTLKGQIEPALSILDLKPGQVMLELGSGDGRMLVAAAKRGINSVGYELNPILYLYSIFKTRKYRSQIKIVWGNYWHKNWPPADGIFVFLLDSYMAKLNKKIIQNYDNPIKLVSFAFKIPERKIDNNVNGLYLYKYNF